MTTAAEHTETQLTTTVHRLSFAGCELLLDTRRALFWPALSCLIVSDLHLEKGSFLRQYNAALPCLDTEDTLTRLEALINSYHPRHVVCLGDSFHDAHADQRMRRQTVERLNGLCQRVDQWSWILGNHDPKIPASLYGEAIPHIRLGPIYLSHEPAAHDFPQIFGHFHPKLQLKYRGVRLNGRCFCVSKSRLLMPAFGAYTGGLSVRDSAISAAMNDEDSTHFLIYNHKLWRFPALQNS